LLNNQDKLIVGS
jgi:hypothetical protein